MTIEVQTIQQISLVCTKNISFGYHRHNPVCVCACMHTYSLLHKYVILNVNNRCFVRVAYVMSSAWLRDLCKTSAVAVTIPVEHHVFV
jgi:hypothetical protein